MNIVFGVRLLAGAVIVLLMAYPSLAPAQTLNGTASSVCGMTVSGAAVGYKGVPFTNVTIDLVTPSGQSTRLATNVAVQNGRYSWAGVVPGLSTIPAGSQIKLTTNRQYSVTISAPACQS